MTNEKQAAAKLMNRVAKAAMKEAYMLESMSGWQHAKKSAVEVAVNLYGSQSVKAREMMELVFVSNAHSVIKFADGTEIHIENVYEPLSKEDAKKFAARQIGLKVNVK